MNDNSLYSETHTVLTFWVDFDCKITMPAVFMLLQEAAWHHANDHNLGYEGLRRSGLFWVLSRMRVEMLRYPHWTNEVRIETWSKPPDNITAYRDFEGFEKDGTKFLQASSTWLILDYENHRPQPLGKYAAQFPHLSGRCAIAEKPSKIPVPTNPTTTAAGAAQPSDIDMHQHVNNTRYVQWVLDSFGMNFLKKNEVKSLEINFLSQAKVNDAYTIATATNPDSCCISVILNKDTSKEIARVRTLWRSK